jgi:hypothetical protein
MADESLTPDLPLRNVLADLQARIRETTGGASPRIVLAEVARRLAIDLALGYFDELPMYEFNGQVYRHEGALGRFLPTRRVRHRVLLGRYLRGSFSALAGGAGGLVRVYARIGILGVGSDGELRVGQWSGMVAVPATIDGSGMDALPWSDIRLRNVPPRAIVMREWMGSPDPRDVATPAQVVEALGRLASKIAEDSHRDLSLLQRYL